MILDNMKRLIDLIERVPEYKFDFWDINHCIAGHFAKAHKIEQTLQTCEVDAHMAKFLGITEPQSTYIISGMWTDQISGINKAACTTFLKWLWAVAHNGEFPEKSTKLIRTYSPKKGLAAEYYYEEHNKPAAPEVVDVPQEVVAAVYLQSLNKQKYHKPKEVSLDELFNLACLDLSLYQEDSQPVEQREKVSSHDE